MRASQHAGLLLIIGTVAGFGLALGGTRPAAAIITPQGQQGCAAGTVVGGANLVQNGDFAQGALGFTSQLPNRGLGDGSGVYPDDFNGGGFSIQNGPKSYEGATIIGRPFPGDPQREVPATQTYFYSNVNRDAGGNKLYGPGTAGRAMLWRQEVAVIENTTYNFFAYFDNLLLPAFNDSVVDPVIELEVNGIAAGPPITVRKEPDQWLPIQFSFTTGPGQTTAVLEVYDLANDINGDDFGMTQISLKQCVTGIGVAKAALPVRDNADGSVTVSYVITLRNLGVDPLPLTEIQVTDDLAPTFVGAGSFSVLSLESPTLTVNPSYNGTTNPRMLSGTDQLSAQASATITLRVRVIAGSGPSGKGPFFNRAVANAKAGGIGVEDDTAPGFNPDPDGDGDPKEPSEDRPTPVYLAGAPIYLPLLRR